MISNMEITVTMSAEDFESFRVWQRERGSLEREMTKDLFHLKGLHRTLCCNLIDAIEDEPDSTDENPKIKIVRADALAAALDAACDWMNT